MVADQVQREQRMTQVIEHPHEEHEVEALAEPATIEDRQLVQLDVGVRTSAANRAWAR